MATLSQTRAIRTAAGRERVGVHTYGWRFPF
jgi:hypothetical protein